MKKQKDMDWELFELLEGELTAEQEAELLSKIEGQSDLDSEWAFMQMTQLETPEVTYKHKDKLIKKDTTLLTFTAIQWKRAVALAAISLWSLGGSLRLNLPEYSFVGVIPFSSQTSRYTFNEFLNSFRRLAGLLP